MFSISPQAFGAFKRGAEHDFIVRLATVLRDAVPSLAGEPEPGFSEQVRFIVGRARGFGLESEQAIGAFAISAALLGMDFPDRFRGARQILESREDEARKAELLEHFTLALFEALEG